MASTLNTFSMLVGAGEVVAAGKKKNKNKNKAKEQPVPQVQQVQAPSAPAPVPSSVVAPGADVVVEVAEAKAIFERAAREAKSTADKVKLWKDWIRQAGDRTGKGMKYKDTDGSFLEFKQVIPRSRALEITVEGCINSGLTSEKQSVLAQLLGSFLPHDSGLIDGLASALVRLSGLLSEESPDTLLAAQRAVSNIISALKAGGNGTGDAAASPVAAWLNRITAIDKEIVRQQGVLQKLGVTNKGVITRETTNCAKQLVKLQEEKFDLLQPENVPVAKEPTGALGAGLKSLEDLKAVISGHLKGAESAKGSAQGPQNSSAYKREEELLQQQAQEVSAQIRTLEAQLRSLRSQQQEISERLTQVQQRARSSWEPAKGGKQVTLNANHYRDELATVETLQQLVDPSRGRGGSAQDVQAVCSSQVAAPLSYASDSEQFIGMALKALAEVPGKLNFCKQRIEKAGKLAQLGAAVGEKLLQDSKRQCEESEKLMADTMRMAEDLVSTSLQVKSDMHVRSEALARFNPDGARTITQHLRNIDALVAQVQQQYSAILSGTAPIVPAPVTTPAIAATPVATPAPAAPTPAPAAKPTAGRPTSAAPGPARPHVNGNSAPKAAAPAAPAAPPRTWGKVETPTPVSLAADDSLPTPAEAFKPAGPSSSNDDGFSAGRGQRANRRKA